MVKIPLILIIHHELPESRADVSKPATKDLGDSNYAESL